jgi:MFS family permease
MTGSPAAAGSGRTILVAASSSVLGAIPVFLVGSLAVFIREDLDFGQTQLGIAVAVFFLSSAALSIPGGRVTERLGARKAMLGAAGVTGIAMCGIGFLAASWTGLMAWLVLAGIANGVAQPAGNLALARGVPGGRRGLAFGIKQSSIPGATLIAGAAVPIIGLTVGWRWGFIGGALGAVLVGLIMPRDAYVSPVVRSGKALRDGDAPVLPLVVLAMAATCGAAVGTSLASFYVEGAVTAGFSPGFSGVMLVVGSASGILSRLAVGWYADKRVRGHLILVSMLLGFGGLGFLALAMSATYPVLLLPGTLLGFAAGWGWPGLFNFIVVRLNPNAPAAATSITQTGVFLGGVTGPVAYGAVAENVSFQAAWLLAAALQVFGAILIIFARRMLRDIRLEREAADAAARAATPDAAEATPTTEERES